MLFGRRTPCRPNVCQLRRTRPDSSGGKRISLVAQPSLGDEARPRGLVYRKRPRAPGLLPQHPHQDCPDRPILLAVDQQLGDEGSGGLST